MRTLGFMTWPKHKHLPRPLFQIASHCRLELQHTSSEGSIIPSFHGLSPHPWESIFNGNSYLAVCRVWGVEAGKWYGTTVLTKCLLQGISRELPHRMGPSFLPLMHSCAVPYSRQEPKAKCYCFFSVKPPKWTFCSKTFPHLSTIESIVSSCTSCHWTMAKINICFLRTQYN